MSALADAATDYLALRRSLGHKLHAAGRLLPRYVAYVDGLDHDTVTVATALAWATDLNVAPSSNEPVQTEVVHCEDSCAWRTHSTAAGSSRNGTFPDPGMTITSGAGTSSSDESAVRTRPTSVFFGPGVEATNLTSVSGSRARTS